jgi:phage baseplate assembly protein V
MRPGERSAADPFSRSRYRRPWDFGLVTEQDLTSPAAPRVRVKFPHRDNLSSWWCGILNRGSQSDKDFWIPDVDEMVCVLIDERGESGMVLGSRFSSVDSAPAGMSKDKKHFQFSDGAIVEYDRASHAATINLPAGATLNVAIAGAPVIAIDGSANVVFQGGGPAVARIGDQVEVTDDEGGTLTGQIVSGSTKVFSG